MAGCCQPGDVGDADDDDDDEEEDEDAEVAPREASPKLLWEALERAKLVMDSELRTRTMTRPKNPMGTKSNLYSRLTQRTRGSLLLLWPPNNGSASMDGDDADHQGRADASGTTEDANDAREGAASAAAAAAAAEAATGCCFTGTGSPPRPRSPPGA